MKQLKCSLCKADKPTSDFSTNSKYPRGFDYRCKACNRLRATQYHTENRSEILEKWREERRTLSPESLEEVRFNERETYWRNIRRNLLWRAQERSRKYEWVCDLTIEDIILPEKCPLLNVPFIRGGKNNKWYTYSLDRIDNSKGYIKGNIQIITYLANTMKSKASKEELIIFAKNILKLLENDKPEM